MREAKRYTVEYSAVDCPYCKGCLYLPLTAYNRTDPLTCVCRICSRGFTAVMDTTKTGTGNAIQTVTQAGFLEWSEGK